MYFKYTDTDNDYSAVNLNYLNSNYGFSNDQVALSTSVYQATSDGYVYINDWSGTKLKCIILDNSGTAQIIAFAVKSSETSVFVKKGTKIKLADTLNSSQQAVFRPYIRI